MPALSSSSSRSCDNSTAPTTDAVTSGSTPVDGSTVHESVEMATPVMLVTVTGAELTTTATEAATLAPLAREMVVEPGATPVTSAPLKVATEESLDSKVASDVTSRLETVVSPLPPKEAVSTTSVVWYREAHVERDSRPSMRSSDSSSTDKEVASGYHTRSRAWAWMPLSATFCTSTAATAAPSECEASRVTRHDDESTDSTAEEVVVHV
mmetsp:Transcript_16007/g.48929  ORF Transcript_16007/g.48929 Transcript_16007/m.48929 type:complete len:210 (+) Transcript_16007:2644-3273(+)